MSEQRIFLGTVEIVRQLHELSHAFRRLGYVAETALFSRHLFYAALSYNFILDPELPLPKALAESQNPIVRYPRGLLNQTYRTFKKLRFPDFLNAYDIYVFQFGESLLPENRDFPLLKAAGKKIISIFQGSDIRHWSATEPLREAFGLKAYPAYRNKNSINDSLRRLRMAEKYADVIFFQPSYGELAVRPYHHLYLALNLELYPHNVPARDVPVVVHAPSNRQIKGTAEILATFERLKGEGVEFELTLMEGLPNEEVIRQLVNADVVVDELNEAHYGMLGLEGMATGCAVAGGNHSNLVPIPKNVPVLHLNPDNLYDQLRRLLTDKSLRLGLAQAGRPFVEKHHDRVNVAQYMLDRLASGDSQADYYPSFFTTEYRLSEGETIDSELKELTGQIVKARGLPYGVDPDTLKARGLITGDFSGGNMPRWAPNTSGSPEEVDLEEALPIM